MREEEMQKNYYTTVLVLIVLAAGGCGHYGALEADYGKSYNQAKAGQIMNPQASQNLQPVTGIPGEAAAASEEKYLQSFGKAPKKPASKSFVVPVIPGGAAGVQ
jgi:hypothetical protein